MEWFDRNQDISEGIGKERSYTGLPPINKRLEKFAKSSAILFDDNMMESHD